MACLLYIDETEAGKIIFVFFQFKATLFLFHTFVGLTVSIMQLMQNNEGFTFFMS